VTAALRHVGGKTFASVRRHPNFRLYFTGQMASFTGTWMQQIAAAWLVLQLTGSPIAVGALALVQLLPVTILGLFVGSLLDRIDVWRTTVACETLALITAGALAALTLTHQVTTAAIFVLVGIQGVINAVDSPARHALIFRMVGTEDLPNAVALMSSLGTLARILGPAIGGLVLVFAGAGACFAVNSASFLAILIVLLLLDRSRMLHVPTDPAASFVRGARTGVRFVRSSERASVAFGVVFVLATFAFNFNVLLPLLAQGTLHRGAQTFGLIAAVFGAGALVGALINAFANAASLRRLLIGAIGYGLFELLLAPAHTLVLVCALLFAVGVFYTLWGTSALTVMQLEAPPSLRGRAASMYFFAFQGGAPLGGLLAGWLVAVGGTTLAFVLGGVLSLAAAAGGVTLRLRSQRQRLPLPA
jgi:MFS family permease